MAIEDQCLAKNERRVAAANAARSKPARIRTSREAGVDGIGLGVRFGGTGGSRTPAAMNLRGGKPPRTEDACGSSSASFSVNS